MTTKYNLIYWSPAREGTIGAIANCKGPFPTEEEARNYLKKLKTQIDVIKDNVIAVDVEEKADAASS